MKSAANSASAADDITVLMFRAMDNTGPLVCGMGSFSKTKMWDPTQLLALVSLRKLASECAARIMPLALYVVPLLGYVAT